MVTPNFSETMFSIVIVQRIMNSGFGLKLKVTLVCNHVLVFCTASLPASRIFKMHVKRLSISLSV